MKRREYWIIAGLILGFAVLLYLGNHLQVFDNFRGNSDEETFFGKHEFRLNNPDFNHWRVRGGIFTFHILEFGSRFGITTVLHRLVSITGLAFLFALLRKKGFSVLFSAFLTINLFFVSFGYYNSTISLPIFMAFFWIGCYFEDIKKGYFWMIAILTKFSSVFLAPFFLNKVWKNKVWLGMTAVALLFLNEICYLVFLVNEVSRDHPHTLFAAFYWSLAWLSDNLLIVILMIVMIECIILCKGVHKNNSLLLLASLCLMYPLLAKVHLQYFIMWSCAAIYTLLILNDQLRNRVQKYQWIGIIILGVILIHRLCAMFIMHNPLF
jgi:hypothetical protein